MGRFGQSGLTGSPNFTAGKKHGHDVLRRYVADGDGPQEVNG
jgi:hypothetical protein